MHRKSFQCKLLAAMRQKVAPAEELWERGLVSYATDAKLLHRPGDGAVVLRARTVEWNEEELPRMSWAADLTLNFTLLLTALAAVAIAGALLALEFFGSRRLAKRA